MQGNESPGKITVPNVLCQEHTVVYLLLLSCLVLPCFNSSFRKGASFRKERQSNPQKLFVHIICSGFCMGMYIHTNTHTHTHTHTLTSALKPKGKNSSMDAIHFYLGYNQNLSKYFRVLPIKISYTSLCNVFVSFLTSPEYF